MKIEGGERAAMALEEELHENGDQIGGQRVSFFAGKKKKKKRSNLGVVCS